MRIIPAIDIIDGKCVRLSGGNYNLMKVYNGSPLEVAKKIEDNGFQFLHLVDLDGAKSAHIVNYKTLELIVSKTNLNVDFGGGLKTDSDLRTAFECGAKKITIGSTAVLQPEIFLYWLEVYGADKIILGADFKNRQIASVGWSNISSIDVIDFIHKYEKKGVKSVICTDIEKDGMLQGPSHKLYTEILGKCEINLIASGGISSVEDLKLLQAIGCEGAIIGKAIYEGTITLKELKSLC